MEKKESEFVAYSVLSEDECGKGVYTLYVQSIRVEGRYMIMFKSDDRKELEEVAKQIEEARHLAREKNISILSSLHDLNQALAFGDKFFFMKDGVVKYAGGKEIVTEDVIRDIYDIQVRFETIDGKKVMLPVA